ncbi:MULTISPECIES: hypothetical protein [Kamptonema]|nr:MULTISPECIES: hypothetical protein [Kamptonema]
MQITFLGTSSGVPTRSRNVSSIALRLPQRTAAKELSINFSALT